APLRVAGVSGMSTPLVDADQTTNDSPLPAMPACNMSCDCTAQPVFQAAAGASFCRVRNRGECEHCCPDESCLSHRTPPSRSSNVVRCGPSPAEPLPWREAALPPLLLWPP